MIESSAPLRLAVWSCPRTVSTTLMRAFDGRDDSLVSDEPLYAHYLEATRLDHPLAARIREVHETDWRAAVDGLLAETPPHVRVFYQKHMAHHLLPHVERDYRGWLGQLTHAFLIRHPEEMLTSLLEKLPDAELEDTAYPQLTEIFELVSAEQDTPPPVIDSRDLQEDPEGILRSLCARVGLAFQEGMLEWAPGPRPTDGCWGEHWYGNTLKSTGFAPYRPKSARVPAEKQALLAACMPHYERLHAVRLRPA